MTDSGLDISVRDAFPSANFYKVDSMNESQIKCEALSFPFFVGRPLIELLSDRLR